MALVAILGLALVPTVSRALQASASLPSLIDVCSANGTITSLALGDDWQTGTPDRAQPRGPPARALSSLLVG